MVVQPQADKSELQDLLAKLLASQHVRADQQARLAEAGPATLVAYWWGDAGVDDDKTAVPDNGFTVVDSILLAGALVQCAVATKEVAEAGTYDVTWTATPTQGAQLWLVAVQ